MGELPRCPRKGAIRFLLWVFVLSAWSSGARPAEARRRPYYVVTGADTAAVRPRVLFVVDTSGSMSWADTETGLVSCAWDCEDPGVATPSRMHIARQAMHEFIVGGTGIEFGLMSFDLRALPNPPRNPDKCLTTAGERRFVWDSWGIITLYEGFTGKWRLCADRDRWSYAYPYLRWDELGPGAPSVPPKASGPLPPSPMIGNTETEIRDLRNAERKVQWFPNFLGVRVHLDAAYDPDESILQSTMGDYGVDDGTAASLATLRAEVQGHDFYYWPYVDGFSGGRAHQVNLEPFGYIHDDPTIDRFNVLFTQEPAGAYAALLAPFYLDANDIDVALAPAEAGPPSRARSRSHMLGLTDNLIRGGIGSYRGGTPWPDTIGDPADPPAVSNAYRGHPTLSSYLGFLATHADDALCNPTSVVLLSDGDYTDSDVAAVRHQFHDRLARLRRDLNARVYVLGLFFGTTTGRLNEMACAAAGACDGSACDTPCDDTPAAAWDTCSDPSRPQEQCAFSANSPEEVRDAIARIGERVGRRQLTSGPATHTNDFDPEGSGDARLADAVTQTRVSAYTEWPAMRGHVVRESCTDSDPEDPARLAPWCEPAGFSAQEASEPTFGPCPRSRTWDAGQCLQAMNWDARRLYVSRVHPAVRNKVNIGMQAQAATAPLVDNLIRMGLIPDDGNAQSEADAIARFALGAEAHDGWKLPGLSNSAPTVIRRIPKPDRTRSPEIALRDAHCAGRAVPAGLRLPATLVDFADRAWDPSTQIAIEGAHLPYQEAVLVADDWGMLHAFHLNSGNELWAFLPHQSLPALVEHYRVRHAQQTELDRGRAHGIAGTISQGWAWDAVAAKWRHLALLPFGAGGDQIMMLDVSHMSRHSAATGTPSVEVLWASDDPELAASYQEYLGETWSRPALSYVLAGDDPTLEPNAYVLMGSGYGRRDEPVMVNGQPQPGRALLWIDAITGEVQEVARAGVPSASLTPVEDFALGTDVAVASHCLSGVWSEAQEAYALDVAGRLYRWDFGHLGTARHHEADSGGPWGYWAKASKRFPACLGAGNSCAVSTAMHEPFHFGAAVTAVDRIDPVLSAGRPGGPTRPEEFLLAFASGSPDEDLLAGAELHSSLYIVGDNHATIPSGGFGIPSTYPKLDPATGTASYSRYFRAAVTDIVRTRDVTPFAGGQYTETRTFSPGTRPTRAPHIAVAPVLASDGTDTSAEAFTITFSVHEPPTEDCDPRWFDATNDQWIMDPGSSYRIRYRLSADDTSGFNFQTGATGADLGDWEAGLTFLGVEQVREGACSSGACDGQADTPPRPPCAREGAMAAPVPRGQALPLSSAQRAGFAPAEG